MRRRSACSTALALALLLTGAFARAAPVDFGPYLPVAATFDAEFVVVDYDAPLQELALKLQATMQADPAWFRSYRDTHAGKNPLPWHPRFGIPEVPYLRLQDPVQHFIELSRQRIRVTQVRDGGVIRLTLQGQGLMLDRLTLDGAVPAATTARDTLAFRERVEPGKATMPPAGVHEGYMFRSSVETVRKSKFSETVLIGRYTDGATRGILRYSLSLPGKQSYAYVTYALK